MPLRDPDVCKFGHRHSRVLERRRGKGYLRRRHECLTCLAAGLLTRWPSYQFVIRPSQLKATR